MNIFLPEINKTNHNIINWKHISPGCGRKATRRTTRRGRASNPRDKNRGRNPQNQHRLRQADSFREAAQLSLRGNAAFRQGNLRG